VATYAIGDIQGCYRQLLKLLKKLEFNPQRDRLILLGDLVNRGPQSLEVIRYAMQNEASIDIVLGNHELHLLGVLDGVKLPRPTDTFHDVVNAPDREAIRDWLITRPMAIYEQTRNVVVTHAGIHPEWTLQECLELAKEVEEVLQGPERTAMFENMFGNKPRRWCDSHSGWKRTRFIINALTRMRYLTTSGKMDFEEVRPPGEQLPNLIPWFEYPNRKPIDATIVFGHWSALGVFQEPGVLSLDSGCCWGRRLSAARIDTRSFEIISVRCKKIKLPVSVGEP